MHLHVTKTTVETLCQPKSMGGGLTKAAETMDAAQHSLIAVEVDNPKAMRGERHEGGPPSAQFRHVYIGESCMQMHDKSVTSCADWTADTKVTEQMSQTQQMDSTEPIECRRLEKYKKTKNENILKLQQTAFETH